MSKKLTVIGRGTIGCLVVKHFLNNTDWDIDWMYDPNIPTTSVGESSTPIIVDELRGLFGWTSKELDMMGGTYKFGTLKYNWANQPDEAVMSGFPIDRPAIHFTAYDFQRIAMEFIVSDPRVTVIEGNVDLDNVENIDSDFVYVCTGYPQKEEEFEVPPAVALNAAYVVDCPWDYPEFDATITEARKWGWVFGVPLRNRASIGYMYNSDFVDEEEIKRDLASVFVRHKLKPTGRVQKHKFKPFYRKNPIGPKVAYGGSAAFFFEPIEATTTSMAIFSYKVTGSAWQGNITIERANEIFRTMCSETQAGIAMNYIKQPTRFTSEFWEYATPKARDLVENEIKNHTKWARHLRWVKDEYDEHGKQSWFVGMMGSIIYYKMIENYGIRDYLDTLFEENAFGKYAEIDLLPPSNVVQEHTGNLFGIDYSEL